MSFREILSQVWNNIQYRLFPRLEKDVGKLSDDLKTLVSVLELVRVESFLIENNCMVGRPPKDRAKIARAFIAKSVLKLTYTKQLINTLKDNEQLRIICGWEFDSKIPSESKFSRVFEEFAASSLPDRIHQALIKGAYDGKIIGHIGNDSTPVVGREKALKKKGSRKERKKQANNRYIKEKKGELVSRKQRQLSQTLKEMVLELPKDCDMGMKQNSQGVSTVWKGYKLHASVDDHGIPIAAILTSASLNDCEVGIPLMAKTSKVVDNFYDLMDSAYDVDEIKKYSRSLGHVPIIDFHARSATQKNEKEAETKRRQLLNAFTAEDKRYKNRFPKERFNSVFKEYYGGKAVQYKGEAKVFCHAMFGILTYSAKSLLSFLS